MSQDIEFDIDLGEFGIRSCWVEYTYVPAVKERFEHPGEHAYFDIHAAEIDGMDITKLPDFYDPLVTALKYELER